MVNRFWALVLCFASAILCAQVSGNGSGNYIAKWNAPTGQATSSLTTSLLFDNGKIGVGTTSPIGALDVAGHVTIGVANLDPNERGNALITPLANTGKLLIGWNRRGGNGETDFVANRAGGVSGGFSFYDYTNSGSLSHLMTLNGNGTIGIGTTSPIAALDVAGNVTIGIANLDPNEGGNSLITPLANTGKVLIGWNRSGGNGETDFIANRTSGGSGGFNFYDYTNAESLNELLTLTGSGTVGIGTANPAAKVEVNGSLKISAGSGNALILPDGTSQTTAWTGALCGGDYAESVGVSGEPKHYQPGDVLVIDPVNPERFLKSSTPYSRTVAGVYSTKPGAIGRRSTDPQKVESEIPMAMVGIVPTKVTAQNGSIKLGDLLVTSSIPGYAMKGTDRSQLTGAVVGKALGSLDNGSGLINVLVTLQ